MPEKGRSARKADGGERLKFRNEASWSSWVRTSQILCLLPAQCHLDQS